MKYLQKITLLVLVLSTFITLKADEGMWTLFNIDPQLIEKMKSMGCTLSAEDIYHENNPGLKDAVVLFDGGCTGELVSANGLLFTNHHCGRDKVQKISTDSDNYIRDGYWAKSAYSEIPLKGMNVKFLIKTIDVTTEALELLKKKGIRKVMSDIETQYNNVELGYVASLDSYSTGQYFVSVYQVFEDVRLVGIPPESIGNFGGETDNFEWPRQSADFAVFRIYANDKNLPAKYSACNRPYKPKKFFPISLNGTHENDFALTLGFPFMTQRYISSFDLKEEIEIKHRATVITKGKYIDVIEKELDRSENVRLKYSSKNFSAGNSYKLALGTIKLVNLSPAMENKLKTEEEFKAWISEDSVRLKTYKNCLDILQKNHEDQREAKYAHAVISGALFSDASLLGIRARNIIDILESNDQSKLKNALETYRKWYEAFNKNYDTNTDKVIVKAMIKVVGKELKKELLPDFYKIIEKEYQGDIDKYVENMYTNSALSTATGVANFLDNPALSIKNDPLLIFGTSVYEKLVELKKQTSDLGVEIRAAKRLYEKGIMEKSAGKLIYPDANFSMRLTFGTVSGASPRDGLTYNSHSTLKGVIEKEDTADYEFHVAPKLKELYYKNDFDRYAENGQMFTCFLSSTDISSGNSGSPVINGKGELTGIAFDGNRESLASSIIYEKDKNRSINADIRYVLFIIDKFAGSKYILNELTIK